MKPCDADYQEVNALSQMLCYLENPHMVFGCEVDDLSVIETRTIKQIVTDRLAELLEFQALPFNEFMARIT